MIVVTWYGIKAPMINNRQQFKNILENGVCTSDVGQGLVPDETDIVCGQIQNATSRIDGKNYKFYPKVARLALGAVVIRSLLTRRDSFSLKEQVYLS